MNGKSKEKKQLPVKTDLRAGIRTKPGTSQPALNHSATKGLRVKSNVRAGGRAGGTGTSQPGINHSATSVAKGLRVKTDVRAGAVKPKGTPQPAIQ